VLVSLLLALCGACADVPTGDPGPTTAVALTLIVGDTLQVASVTVATPGDSTLPTEGVPVAPADVNLQVVDDSGVAFPLMPTTTPGRYEVALAPGLGRSYTLQGTVLGRAVSLATSAPQRFDLVSLPNDTITPADTVPCRFAFGQVACFSVVTESDQPVGVLCFVAPNQLPSACSEADGSQLRVPSTPGARDVQILGYSGDALRVRHAETVTQFGSAVLVRRTAVFP